MSTNEHSDRTEILIKKPKEKKEKDKTKRQVIPEYHNPKTATWLALIPGAGQAYNRKYWKMPIVYAGFFATGYLGITNGNDYRLYRDAYDFKTGVNPDVSEKAKEISEKYTGENLVTLRDYYRRNMELSWIIMAAWYAVQIIDASVDAHFMYYEIDDDLTLQVDPKWEPGFVDCAYGYGNGIGTAGLSVKLNF
ncbi:MAG: DUF5683 domain-containing protein [Bacteroidales bacterium]|nr:DUF5683 domain-containing protein [Bacteroidales bacterium]